MMTGVHRLSEVVYHRVNDIIGCQEKVMMRRDKWKIIDITYNNNNRKGHVRLTSGSIGEGLDMKGSDLDIMIWQPYEHVICDLSQVYLRNIRTKKIILMEDQFTRPGFVMLRLFYQICTCNNCRNEFPKICIQVNNHTYISSSLFRYARFDPRYLRNATLHGPCTSGFIFDLEVDCARCYTSKHWPPQAFCWIERCKRNRWPSPSLLCNIIQSGCHFMAIGAKNSPSESEEWRLSFSQAEQKLVHSMNHIQFLVYGLLKLFLKEVLNKDIPDKNKLLCSYFMKTAVFWEVQENVTIQWNIYNFLYFFWSCYKLLMKWVYNQYCPNFFVPQNNMFYPKITGTRQQQLFHQMYVLYMEGLHCLLRCSSIHDELYSALIYPPHPILNTSYFSEYDHDLFLYDIIYEDSVMSHSTRLPKKSALVKKLAFLLTKLRSNISQTQRTVVYRYTVEIIQSLAFLLQINQPHQKNTEMYKIKKQGLRLMKVISKQGCVTDALYLAIFMYNDGRYKHALYLLQEVQSKLYRCHIMQNYLCRYHYLQTVGGQSLSTKMKLAIVFSIIIPFYTKFPELRLELKLREQEGLPFLEIPPFVMLQFLTFLCNYHLSNSAQQQQSLYDLHTLVHLDEYLKVIEGISWEMLGICHQLSKHLYQAIECYLEAQRLYVFDEKQFYRIQAVEQQIYSEQLSQNFDR